MRFLLILGVVVFCAACGKKVADAALDTVLDIAEQALDAAKSPTETSAPADATATAQDVTPTQD